MTAPLAPATEHGHRTAGADMQARSVCYSLYGFQIWSDVPLPAREVPVREWNADAWALRRSAPAELAPIPAGTPVAAVRCYEPCHEGELASAVYRTSAGTAVVAHYGIATWSIDLRRRQIDVIPQVGTDDAQLGLIFSGSVAALILQRLGVPCLHASAVAIEGRAVAFLGPKGQGKSSMAAHFLRCGATLIADDALPLQISGGSVYGVPGLPAMKIWADSARQTLGLGDELPALAPGLDKKLLQLGERYPFASEAVPLRHLYLLDRYQPGSEATADCDVHVLNGRESMAALLSHTSVKALVPPAELARSFPTYAQLASLLPVRVLRYPSGYAFQAAVRSQILADLEA